MTSALESTWFLYIVRCRDGSLYTGITTDVTRRFQEHCGAASANRGAKALRGRQPEAVVFEQAVGNRSEAQKMEYRVKQLKPQRKREIINRRLTLAELVEC